MHYTITFLVQKLKSISLKKKKKEEEEKEEKHDSVSHTT
jgi:hypothetical protein